VKHPHLLADHYWSIPASGAEHTRQLLTAIREDATDLDERARRETPDGVVGTTMVAMELRLLDRIILDLELVGVHEARLRRELRRAKAFTVVATALALVAVAALVVVVARGTV